MKFNWNAIAAIGPIVLVLAGWGVSIEVRMSQRFDIQAIEREIDAMKLARQQEAQTVSNQINAFTTEVRGMIRRIQNLEDLLTPVLVDYKVKKELEKQGLPYFPLPSVVPPPATPAPKSATRSAKPEEDLKFSIAPVPQVNQKPIEAAAQKWASEAIQRGQQLKK